MRSVAIKNQQEPGVVQEQVLTRLHATNSDLSQDDISSNNDSLHSHHAYSYSNMLDANPCRSLKLQIVLQSEQQQHDLYIYDVRTEVKQRERLLVLCRKKLQKGQARVQSIPFRVSGKLLYFEVDAKF